MTFLREKQILVISLIAGYVYLTGCGNNFKQVSGSTKKRNQPGATNNADANQDVKDRNLNSGTGPSSKIIFQNGSSLVNATYNIVVRGPFNMAICEGQLKIRINADAGKNAKLFEITEGILPCKLIGQIDIAKEFGGFNKNAGAPVNDVYIKDNIIRLKQLGIIEFLPPRPMMPAFLNTTKDELQALSFSETISARDMKTGQVTQGEMSLKVLNMGPFEAETAQVTFPKTLTYQLTTSGFNNINKVSGMIFKTLDMVLSLDPVTLVKLHFEGTAYDFMKDREQKGGGGLPIPPGIIGGIINLVTRIVNVKIDMDLVAMDGLKESLEQMVDDE